MTEPTESPSEPATAPVPPPPPVVAPAPPRRSRLTAVAAWVGIVAGVVFIVAVIFFSGFVLGLAADGQHGRHHHGERGLAVFHGGPPMMPPMGRFPHGPMGPGFQPPQPPEPPSSAPGTTAPSRP